MSMKVTKITEPVELGEGPHWDARQQALYFVSIQDCSIHKFVPSTGVHNKTKMDGHVAFIIPVEGTSDQFVVGFERKLLVVSWDGGDGTPARVVRELGEVHKDEPNIKFNDGKADPRGRVFAGTMGHGDQPGQFAMNKGALFRMDERGIAKVETGVTISNGLAWDLREKAFYYTDSLERNVRRYDYDVETGEISNMKHIFDFEKNNIEGVPDGTTIDTDGNLYVCVFGASCVLQIDPRTSRLLRKVPIPALQVTSAAWGGPGLDTLFVTTGNLNISEEQKPPCGACFMVTGLGARGHPNVNVKLN